MHLAMTSCGSSSSTASRSCLACENSGVASGGDLGDRFDQGFQLRQAALAAGARPEGAPRACSAQRAAGRARGWGRRPRARGCRERRSGGAGPGMGGGSPRGAATGRSERGCGAWHREGGRGRRGCRAAPVQRPAARDRRRGSRRAGIRCSNEGSRGGGGSRGGSGRNQRPVPSPAARHRAALRFRLPCQVPAGGSEPRRRVRAPSLRRHGARPGRAWRPGAVAACGLTRFELIAVEGLPEVRPGDDLGELISSRSKLETGDVLVVAQKVVSKSEGRLVNIRTVTASDEAVRIASQLVASPDPRMVQVVLDESVRVIRSERALITETRHGFVCANGGVDHSNVPGDAEPALLPEDPDASANRLRNRLRELTRVTVGVIISDTFGRPWRLGIVNVALGVAGLPALLALRGSLDDDGKQLQATVLAPADELAAAAGLVMGKTNRAPVVIIRGSGLHGNGTGRDLIRPAAEDLFR